MIRTMGWEKRFLITFIITLFLFFIIQAKSIAFGPAIVDVTTKAFSVAWTTGGPYSDCNIRLYTDVNYDTERTDIDLSQIIIETSPGQPGEDGKQYGIAKVTVVGLDVGTQYFFGITENGGAPFFKRSVTTESLKGMNSNDPNDNDIVSNDVVHKAVYKTNGTSPALGALVLAEIYPYNADVYTDTPLSDYPISGWVGDGMIGDEDSSVYNPENISYKQYAAINMNNLFGATDHFPLSLKGDDPTTPTVNESEKIKFTIVHGTLGVFGQDPGEDHFTSVGRVESIDKANNDKITTAKVSVSFNFESGLNSFTFPFNPTKEYKTKQLWEAIEAAGGQPITIFTFKGSSWIPTIRLSATRFYNGDIVIGEGDACIINMNNSISKENELSFYGKPLSSKIELFSGIDIFSIPQCPSLYKTENMWRDIEALEGVSAVIAIYSFLKPWAPTIKISDTRFFNSLFMTSSRIYAVVLELKPGVTSVIWDPFPND